MAEDPSKDYQNIDLDKGLYKTDKITLKIRDITQDEMEKLQDEEISYNDSVTNSDIDPKDFAKVLRKHQEFILDIAFGPAWKKENLKKKLTGFEYTDMINEVHRFLGTYSGPTGAHEYMTRLTAKKASGLTSSE